MKHLITACALAALSLVAQAQSVPAPEAPLLPTNPKLEWAIKVVALQQGPDMDRLVTQLVSSTTRDMVGNWEPRLTQVAKDRLPAATSELNAQLQKYADEVGTIIRAKVPQVGTEALVPMYMERFSMNELEQIATFLQAPAIRKYQSIAPELGAAFTRQLIEASRTEVIARAQQFDTAASNIVGLAPAAATAAPTPAPTKPAKK